MSKCFTRMSLVWLIISLLCDLLAGISLSGKEKAVLQNNEIYCILWSIYGFVWLVHNGLIWRYIFIRQLGFSSVRVGGELMYHLKNMFRPVYAYMRQRMGSALFQVSYQHKTVTWTNDDLLLSVSLGTKFSDMWIKLSFTETFENATQFPPICPGLVS